MDSNSEVHPKQCERVEFYGGASVAVALRAAADYCDAQSPYFSESVDGLYASEDEGRWFVTLVIRTEHP